MINRRPSRGFWVFVVSVLLLGSVACTCPPCSVPFSDHDQLPDYQLLRVFEVEGRQGIATDGERYFNSGSTALFVYSKDGELLAENTEPFADLERAGNHIGDISVHDGELFAGIEWFEDGRGTDIQIAVYDTETLLYKKSIDWDPESGQVEVSALAVDAETGSVWMTDWVNGTYVYRYDMATALLYRQATSSAGSTVAAGDRRLRGLALHHRRRRRCRDRGGRQSVARLSADCGVGRIRDP